MMLHNRVWLIVLLLLWAALFGSAALTRGFSHVPDWAPAWVRGAQP